MTAARVPPEPRARSAQASRVRTALARGSPEPTVPHLISGGSVNPFGAAASLELHATSVVGSAAARVTRPRPSTASTPKMRGGVLPPSDTRTTFVVKQVGEPTVPKLNLQAGEQLMPVVVATRGAFIRAK